MVIPALNSASTIEASVTSALEQDYPGDLEVVVAVGPSTDDTKGLLLGITDERLKVVANPDGGTSAGLNAAIYASSGEVIVRCDAHARLPSGYVQRAVEILEETGAANVGGIQAAEGERPVQRAVAMAQTTPTGVGDARYRTGGKAGPVDTVYLGVFRRKALDDAGLFDERQVRNQDYELNWRIREDGGTVWFDPSLRVAYSPRSSFRSLWRQYFEYGMWKRVMLRRHPDSLRWRQLVPPLVVLALIASLVLLATPWRLVGAVVPAIYVAALLITAFTLGVTRRDWAAVLVPIALPTMHISWGLGFMVGREWLQVDARD